MPWNLNPWVNSLLIRSVGMAWKRADFEPGLLGPGQKIETKSAGLNDWDQQGCWIAQRISTWSVERASSLQRDQGLTVEKRSSNLWSGLVERLSRIVSFFAVDRVSLRRFSRRRRRLGAKFSSEGWHSKRTQFMLWTVWTKAAASVRRIETT